MHILKFLNFFSVGLSEDFDHSEPKSEGHSGVGQEVEESALPLVSKGKRTRAHSCKDNSGSESKQTGLSQRSRNKPTLAILSCDEVDADDHSHSLKTRDRHTRRSPLPSVVADGEFRV